VRKNKENIIVSLRQAYLDLILLSLFFGLIGAFVLTLYIYLIYGETFHAMLAFVMGILSVLTGIAEFVFPVEFWRAIWKSWTKRKRREK